MSASGLPLEPLTKPELSLIGARRWNFFAALLFVALIFRRWRDYKMVKILLGGSLRRRQSIVAAVVLCASAVIAALLWWPQARLDAIADVAQERAPALVDHDAAMDFSTREGEARGDARCAQCGVVESTREVDPVPEIAGRQAGERQALAVNAARTIEVTVRTKDGTSHLFTAAKSADVLGSANWRPGERVIFIAGRSLAKD